VCESEQLAPREGATVNSSTQPFELRKTIVLAEITCPFPHRHNRDGSYDSICLKCYATVASFRDEAELAAPERDHSCEPVRLSHFTRGGTTWGPFALCS
jgi:hypothetical protein